MCAVGIHRHKAGWFCGAWLWERQWPIGALGVSFSAKHNCSKKLALLWSAVAQDFYTLSKIEKLRMVLNCRAPNWSMEREQLCLTLSFLNFLEIRSCSASTMYMHAQSVHAMHLHCTCTRNRFRTIDQNRFQERSDRGPPSCRAPPLALATACAGMGCKGVRISLKILLRYSGGPRNTFPGTAHNASCGLKY